MFKAHTNGHRHVCKKCQYQAELSNPEAYKNRLIRMKRYRDSEQGRAKNKEYSQSTEGKISRKLANKRYIKTDIGYLNKYNTTAKRRAARLKRTPKWLTEDDLWIIREIYKLAADRTKLHGFSWHVDHIVPLQGDNVSGLHTIYNLQVIPGVENSRKRNKFEVV